MDRQVVCITGASSGFGLACAHKFSKLGYDTILVGRREDRLKALAIEIIETYKTDAFVVVCDVQAKNDVTASFSQLPKEKLPAINRKL